MREIAFGEWLPDLPQAAEATSDVLNMIPTAVDPFRPEVIYGPIPTPNRLSLPALTDRPTAMIGFLDNSAAHINIVGTDSDLQRMNTTGTKWASVAPTDETYAGVAPWDMTRFGDNIIAARPNYFPVIFKVGATKFERLGGAQAEWRNDTAYVKDKEVRHDGSGRWRIYRARVNVSASSQDSTEPGKGSDWQSSWEDVRGCPPPAGLVAAVGEFAVIADIKEHPARVQWSGFDNVEVWGDITRQSEQQDLFAGGGRIRKIVPGDHGWIFQESAITRMQYVGPPFFFRFDVVRPNLGTRSPRSVVWHGSDIFFYGNNGFYRMNRDSGSIFPIGASRVDQYFLENVQTNGFEELHGSIDYRRQLVWWSYPKGAGNRHFDEALIYHYGINKWSRMNYAHGSDRGAILTGGFQMPDLSLDSLDGTQWFPKATGMDTPNTPSLDDPRFFGALEFVLFTQDSSDGNYYANILAGEAYPASICTSQQHQHGDILYVSRARPLVDGQPEVRLRWHTRESDTAAPDVSEWVALNVIGEAPQRIYGRYICAEMELRGQFSRARGVAADHRIAGTR